MTIASHMVPHGSIPESAMRENLSKAYLNLVASAAGLVVGTWGNDYDGIDSSLKSQVNYAPYTFAPQLDVQLKCTGQERAIRANTVAWSLEVRTLEYLREPNRNAASLFCVLVAPDGPGFWLSHDLNGMLARSHMYWLRGSDLPEPKHEQEHQTVHLPKANTVTAASVLELMEEASRWRQ